MEKTLQSESDSLKKKNNKTAIVKLRVDENELAQLKKQAENHKSISDFIRFSCLKRSKNDKNISKKTEIELNKLIKEVNAVGKNVNQVARYVNFLEDNGINYAASIARFNQEITTYTALQIRIETLLKHILKD